MRAPSITLDAFGLQRQGIPHTIHEAHSEAGNHTSHAKAGLLRWSQVWWWWWWWWCVCACVRVCACVCVCVRVCVCVCVLGGVAVVVAAAAHRRDTPLLCTQTRGARRVQRRRTLRAPCDEVAVCRSPTHTLKLENSRAHALVQRRRTLRAPCDEAAGCLATPAAASSCQAYGKTVKRCQASGKMIGEHANDQLGVVWLPVRVDGPHAGPRHVWWANRNQEEYPPE